MSSNIVRVALAQLNSDLGNVEGNLQRAVESVERASDEGADLVLFPELYLQGYRADELFPAQAEPIPGPSTHKLTELAGQRGIYIVMGLARREMTYPHLVYNSACLVGPEGLLGYYDKMHLGSCHPYREAMYFAPGTSTPVFDTSFGRVSLQICYDIWFPELTRVYAIKGSTLNLIVSAGPSDLKDDWDVMLRARSIENLFPSVYCNVVGWQKDFSFFGGSKIVDARGNFTVEAKIDHEDFVIGSVDLELGETLRRQWLRFRDRVPSSYQAIAVDARMNSST